MTAQNQNRMPADWSLSRRAILAGIASLPIGSASFADDAQTSPIAHGVLKDNKIAQAFEPCRRDFPEVNVVGPNGTRPISQVANGRTILIPLWAEWCAPCLTELGDFARLQEVYGNGKFAIVPVLTGSTHKFTLDLLGKFLSAAHAGIFEPLFEEDLGKKLFNGMAYQNGESKIPCNLLVAPDGSVVAREIGLEINNAAADTNAQRLSQALAGNSQSLWGTPAGDEFAVCMANGFLTS